MTCKSFTIPTLTEALLSRFEHVGDRSDLNDAIIEFQAGLELITPGHSLRSTAIHSIAVVPLDRFD